MIRLGSRGSELALCQSRLVAAAVKAATGADHTMVVIKTAGDRIQDRPLSQVEGKGFFTKEIEEALLAGRIDVAVHSFKDLPTEDTPGLMVAAVCERHDPADCLLVRPESHDPAGGLLRLRHGARVGTSSLRRRAFLLHYRPDLDAVEIRGNVTTRIERLREGRYDAILLARAGLVRLQPRIDDLVLVPLPVHLVVPAPAQGALAVQVRSDDARARELVAAVHHEATAQAARSERALLALLGGGCSVPLGALVTRSGLGFRLEAALFGAGSRMPLRVHLRGADAELLAEVAARRLLPARNQPLREQRLLLVRPAEKGEALADSLRAAGAEVFLLPVTRLRPIDPDPRVMAELPTFRWIACTSRQSVERLAAVCAGRLLRGVRFAAVGEDTAEALLLTGLCQDPLLPAEPTGAGLAKAMLTAGCGSTTPVLFPCVQEPRPELLDGLTAAGVPVTLLPLYRTERQRERDLPRLPEGPFDVSLFTSPSGVEAFFALSSRPQSSRTLALGPTTAAALRSHGVTAFRTAAAPTPHDVIEELSRP